MACLTLLAQATIMCIVLSVAASTCRRDRGARSIHMAGAAIDAGMCSGQLETDHSMVEADISPLGGCVARGAIISQCPLMRIVHLVAADTSGAGRVEVLQRPGADVAIVALERFVSRNQRKSCLGVIEIGAVGIQPVVAIETRGSEGDLMRHERRAIHFQVALGTGLPLEMHQARFVTIFTSKGFAISQGEVRGEGKTEGVVREGRLIHPRQGSEHSVVFGMAIPARARVGQFSMERGRDSQFGLNIFMALKTAVRHGLGAPERCMAIAAGEIGVDLGRLASYTRRMPSERAGAEDPAAG
ncbi:MAG: hypothetical protein WBZ24_07845 [Anaerolineales bacterium]